jgi:glyoxylase-like metal-dependent hydrolase (beta-lactamase superfamily II)
MTDAAVCDRMYCLTLGWEYCAESVSLEGGGDEILREPLMGVLVHAPIGWVLLETGMDRRRFADPTRPTAYPKPPEFPTDGDALIDAMAALGLAPSDLALAAVSHLHLDHSGGLRHLAAAGVEVAIQREELRFAREDTKPGMGYTEVDYGVEGLRWRELDGDAELTPGIDAIATPGHTPGHMSYRVRMAQSGTWIFAVDAIDLQRGIDEDRTIGGSVRPQDAPLVRVAHDRLVALAAADGARLVPGHCPVTWPTLSHAEGYR